MSGNPAALTARTLPRPIPDRRGSEAGSGRYPILADVVNRVGIACASPGTDHPHRPTR
jgi:hypothetical protein